MGRLTNAVSEGFIWSVGITRPKPGHENRAAIFITVTLAMSVVLAVGMFLFLKSQIL